MDGIGPVDPDLARDLARSAAANPKTTWCVTVTDQDGHAIGHGCARPEPKSQQARHGKPGGHDPPGTAGEPRFTFTPDSRDGRPGGWGTWRLSTGIPGRPDLIISIGPITTDPCDHRHQARGHDPGLILRHLTQIRNATAPDPDADGPQRNATSSTTCPTKPADARVRAMGIRSAGTTTG
jgi:hypothetical protein